MEPISIVGAAKILKRPIDDLYDLGKSRYKERLKKWQATSHINALYKKINSVQKVKTIWQVDKEVSLKTFYFPSKIMLDEKPVSVNKIDSLPTDSNLVVQGTVGQGKSIFLRYLCSQELRIGTRIPLFVELRKINDKTGLIELLYDTLNSWGFDIDDELFDFFASSGKFILLLDGFDEIKSANVQGVVSKLESLSEKFEKLLIIVTSRPDSGIEKSCHFRVVQLVVHAVNSVTFSLPAQPTPEFGWRASSI